MAVSQIDYEAELADWVASTYDDPLGFVLGAFQWGEAGTALEREAGPDEWQREQLEEIGRQVRARKFNGTDPVAPIREAVSSGHGIGKSVEVAWLILWIMSTRPGAQGSVTANTMTQLETKTWASLQKWTKLCITGHWFTINSEKLYYTGRSEDWFCARQSSKEENSEAFAGQHAKTSTSFYIFDEASAIADKIFEVAEGGLTDGEPMIFLFGNPTRRTGKFYRVCFGEERSRWDARVVDCRTSRFTNKQQLQEWIEDYGEDSDFCRVRIKGMPPRASDAQFIDHDRVIQAQKRQVVVLPDEPLVAGCDLAWGGEDSNVIRFRRGNDARSIPAIRVPGEFTRDPAVLTQRLAEVLSKDYDGQRVRMLFLDSAGIAGPIGQRLRGLGFSNVSEVNFGSDSPSDKCRFMRDFMWWRMKEWLLAGAIDASPRLESDLIGPGIRTDSKQRVWLESKEDMKKRGLSSPDEADALCLTFAQTLGPTVAESERRRPPVRPKSAWS